MNVDKYQSILVPFFTLWVNNPFLVKLDCNRKNLKTNEIRIYFLTFWDSGSSSCSCSCICNIDEEENTLARFLPLVIDHNPSKS